MFHSKLIVLKFSSLAAFLLLVSVSAQAVRICTAITSNTTLYPPDLTIQKDTAVDSPISAKIITNQVKTYNCSGTDKLGPSQAWENYGVKAYGHYVKNIGEVRIYSTNIDGIGYAVFGTDKTLCMNATGWVGNKNTGDGNPNNAIICGVSAPLPIPWEAILGIQFYKYKEITGSGKVTSKIIGSFIQKTPAGNWAIPEAKVDMATFNINTVSCQLMHSETNVDMGNVFVSDFSGINSYPGDNNTKDFMIKLNCNAGAKLNFKFSGSVYNADKGVFNTENSDQGVGLQLLYNNIPLTLDKDIPAHITSNGINTLNFKARYYQIKKDIKTGPANSSAVITVSFY